MGSVELQGHFCAIEKKDETGKRGQKRGNRFEHNLGLRPEQVKHNFHLYVSVSSQHPPSYQKRCKKQDNAADFNHPGGRGIEKVPGDHLEADYAQHEADKDARKYGQDVEEAIKRFFGSFNKLHVYSAFHVIPRAGILRRNSPPLHGEGWRGVKALPPSSSGHFNNRFLNFATIPGGYFFGSSSPRGFLDPIRLEFDRQVPRNPRHVDGVERPNGSRGPMGQGAQSKMTFPFREAPPCGR